MLRTRYSCSRYFLLIQILTVRSDDLRPAKLDVNSGGSCNFPLNNGFVHLINVGTYSKQSAYFKANSSLRIDYLQCIRKNANINSMFIHRMVSY